MLKYACLVFDHDDTVVCSEASVNYPAFLEALRILRPGETLSLQDFSLWNFQEGFAGMCFRHFGFTLEEFEIQSNIWRTYVKEHPPAVFPGLDRIFRRQLEAGGLVCVSSHSASAGIRRDYLSNFGFEPHGIYDWDLGPEKRKPHRFALDDIMERFHLTPKDILMVDDLDTGYHMATARAVDFAWAGWGRGGSPEIAAFMAERCNLAFYSVQELENFLFTP